MKNWRVTGTLFTLFSLSSCIYGDEKTGQSYMFTRPVYRNIAAQRFLFDTFAADKQGNVKGIFQIMPMYQETLSGDKHVDKIGRYFFIHHKNTLIVKGDLAPDSAQTRDVRAEWFQLSADYDGTITIRPKQQQLAVWIEYQQDIKRFIDWELLESAWVSIAIPVQRVQNDLQFSEQIITPSTTPGLTNMQEAFIRPDLKYGKIGPKKSKVSVAEIMFKLGATFLNRDGYNIYMYSLFVIPTQRPDTPDFLFNPVLGNNGYVGWNTGVNFQIPLNDCTDEQIVAFFFEAENIMFFNEHQKRILDLKGRTKDPFFDYKYNPWSRYLLVNSADGEMNIPAATVFTHDVNVKPFNYVDLAFGFRWYTSNFEAEIGYALWAHGKEELQLEKHFYKEYGIAGQGTFINEHGILVGKTASTSTIQFQGPNDVNEQGDPIFVPIRYRDLNFLKGATRATLLNQLHMGIGYRISNCNGVEGFIGLGGYIEGPMSNTALPSWGFWAKGGLSI